MTVTNNGPDAATNVTVTDNLPTGYTYVSDDSGGDYNNGTGIWSVGGLANGTNAVLNITVTVNETGNYTNTATVTGDQNDPDPDNNEDEETPENVINASMSITKAATMPDIVEKSALIIYTIIVTNTGNATITNIVITDDNALITDGNPILSLDPGESATVTAVHAISYSDIIAGVVINTAIGTGLDPNGNDVTDDSDDPADIEDYDNNGDNEPDDPTEVPIVLTNVNIPEGFSPNNDGINDVLVIRGLEEYPDNRILILNRWGNKVYEAGPYLNDWDGKNYFGVSVGSDDLPEGTYFYLLNLDNGKKVLKGYVYLKR